MSGFLGGGIGPVALKRRRAAAADWWQVAGQTCVAAYQPIGAASLAASYVNLANPGTYNAAPGVAPTLGAGGWSFGGAQYLTTGIVPGRAWSMAVRFAGVSYALNTNMLVGVQNAGNTRFYLWPAAVETGCTYGNGIPVSKSGGIYASGVMALAGGQGYYAGSADVASWSPGAEVTTSALFVGAHNSNGTPVHFLSGTITAVAIYSTTLSAADVAALTTRMQALA